MYVTMECPEVFRMGEYWYLVYSTFSDCFTTHYRIAKSLDGPWMIPEDDVFDTRADYAIKTASDGEHRYAFGWIANVYELPSRASSNGILATDDKAAKAPDLTELYCGLAPGAIGVHGSR